MKQLIFILLFPITVFGQTVSDTCFTEQQIHDISETLDELYYQDSVNNALISQQDAVIEKQDQLLQQKKLQPKWYNNKVIWFSSGILTTILTGKLIVGAIQ